MIGRTMCPTRVLNRRPAKLFTQPSAPPPSSAELQLPEATDSNAGVLCMVQLVSQQSRSVMFAAVCIRAVPPGA